MVLSVFLAALDLLHFYAFYGFSDSTILGLGKTIDAQIKTI